MKARRLSLPFAIYVVLTCASIAFFIFYGKEFPPAMALPFGLGNADGHMDRVKFIVLGSFVSLMVPTLIVALVGVLPRVLSGEGRRDAQDLKLWAGLWLACLAQALLIAFFVSIYRANLR